jgi:hypothetical protein
VTEGFSWKFRPGAQKLIASATLVLAIEKKTRRLAAVAYGDPVLQRDHSLRQDATGDGSEGRHQRTRRVRQLERCVCEGACGGRGRHDPRRDLKARPRRSTAASAAPNDQAHLPGAACSNLNSRETVMAAPVMCSASFGATRGFDPIPPVPR